MIECLTIRGSGSRQRLYRSGKRAQACRGFIQAAPLVSRNRVRRTQDRIAHAILDEFGVGCPVLLLGDYNYPFFISGLRKQTRREGYELASTDKRIYSKLLLFRARFDFVSSRDFHVRTVHALPKGKSDHRPILVLAEVKPAVSDTHVVGGSSMEADMFPEIAYRFVGHRDVTSWSTRGGRELAHLNRWLTERIGQCFRLAPQPPAGFSAGTRLDPTPRLIPESRTHRCFPAYPKNYARGPRSFGHTGASVP